MISRIIDEAVEYAIADNRDKIYIDVDLDTVYNNNTYEFYNGAEDALLELDSNEHFCIVNSSKFPVKFIKIKDYLINLDSNLNNYQDVIINKKAGFNIDIDWLKLKSYIKYTDLFKK